MSKSPNGEALFNGYNKTEILDPRLKGLNLYARLSYQRFKLDSETDTARGNKPMTK